MVEQVTLNHKVVGSTPTRPTFGKPRLARGFLVSQQVCLGEGFALERCVLVLLNQPEG